MTRADQLAVDDKAVRDFALEGEVSEAEITAGAAQERKWLSLRRLRLGFSASFGQNGYLVFPVWLGSLMLQWGRVATPTGDAVYPVAFPLSFLADPFVVHVSAGFSGSTRVDDGVVAQYYSPTKSGFTANRQDVYSVISRPDAYISWFAIGR